MWGGHSCPPNLTTRTLPNPIPGSGREKYPAILKCQPLQPYHLLEAFTSLPTATFRRYEYRRRLPHYQKDDRPLFVTFRTKEGFGLSPDARTLTLQHCLHDNGKTIQLHAAVVMPDHVPVLFTALRDANGWTFALPEILRAIKGTSARSINKLAARTGPVWQDESFDHVVRGNESLRETIDYIRQNPVRKGLVKKREDYPWLWVESCGAGTPAREI